MQYDYIKRGIDIVLSLCLVIIFLPIDVIVALLIKLESPGAPIFVELSDRVGKNGKLFRLLKFRSMIPNAHYKLYHDPKFKDLLEEYKKNSYKVVNDPRVTKMGKFIRKFSIDESPQLINILKGDMSLVGPRPYYPEEIENQRQKYPQASNLITDALSVRPGLTGEWQVSGRSEINFDKRIEMDSRYAQNHNLWYDLKILLRTPLVMLSGKGAV
ncbi:MAG: sugar transferase [bacterium]|nr:sugar transferase [bacterium]